MVVASCEAETLTTHFAQHEEDSSRRQPVVRARCSWLFLRSTLPILRTAGSISLRVPYQPDRRRGSAGDGAAQRDGSCQMSIGDIYTVKVHDNKPVSSTMPFDTSPRLAMDVQVHGLDAGPLNCPRVLSEAFLAHPPLLPPRSVPFPRPSPPALVS